MTVVGAGVVGLWQAYELAQRGHSVILREAAPEISTGAASRIAGAMLAPYCESETADPFVKELGLRSLKRWREVCCDLPVNGTIVVAPPRDRAELARFARLTDRHRLIGATELAQLEPELEGRFDAALYFPGEAHLPPRVALSHLVDKLRARNVDLRFSAPVTGPLWLAAAAGEVVIDCRGISAINDLAGLRGVRGEMAVVRALDVQLSRPVRLLHPRFPVYVVPWGEGTYMIGATMLESTNAGDVSARSAFELLASACVVHPSFAAGQVLELSTGIRPAYDDNLPRLRWRGRCLSVNGAYRHGFLLAPALAEFVADHLESCAALPPKLLSVP